MTIPNYERRTTRRMLFAGALATVGLLTGAAALIFREPSAQPAVISAPRPVVASVSAILPGGWATLTPVEQGTLQPLQAQWAELGPAAKAHWIQVADRLNGRPSRAVARAAQHMPAWQRLSPAERAQARLHYQLASRLSPAERERRWKSYQASVHAAPQVRDESRRALTAAAHSAPLVGQEVATPLTTEVQAGVPTTLRVRAVQSNARASAAATGDAS
jgi:hypothetical protein